MRKPSLIVETLVPAGVAIFAAALFFNVQGMSTLSVMFPYAIILSMAVLGAIVIVSEAADRRTPAVADEGEEDDGEAGSTGIAAYRNPAIVIVSAAAYVVLVNFVGYFAATAVYTFAFLVMFRHGLVKSAAIAAGFVAFLYIVFVQIFQIGL